MINDKLKHFIVCAGITLILLVIFLIVPHSEMYGWDKAISVAVGFIAAFSKEIVWDKWLGKGTPDFYDFFWGFSGSVAVMFIWVIIETIIVGPAGGDIQILNIRF